MEALSYYPKVMQKQLKRAHQMLQAQKTLPLASTIVLDLT